LDEIRANGDYGRAEKVQTEIDFLERELVRAVGLGNRDRRANSNAERARLSVTRAIKGALAKIAEHHVVLGQLLRDSIKTGICCTYSPQPNDVPEWRFEVEAAEAATAAVTPVQAGAAETLPQTAPLMVGRKDELFLFELLLEKARQGVRQVVFISGPAGIGKTTFVAACLAIAAHDYPVQVGRGQCIEQYGAGEPYMPVLEALTRLGQTPGGDRVVEVLRSFAPTWLAQMPALPTQAEREGSHATMLGVTRPRMLRELTLALETLAAETPIVLVLEDLHWSDVSTLELIEAVARRTEPARLLLLGTFRTLATMPSDHPLRRTKEELELHHDCTELSLKLLNESEVADYLGLRFATLEGEVSEDQAEVSALAPAIYRRTEGNPLFMVNVVDYLVAQGPQLDVTKVDAPRSLRQMILRNVERLTAAEQSLLENAAVAGTEFSASLVASAMERPVDDIEAACARLAHNEQFITTQDISEWPDGTRCDNLPLYPHALPRSTLPKNSRRTSRRHARPHRCG
jgi:hypothetical protein